MINSQPERLNENNDEKQIYGIQLYRRLLAASIRVKCDVLWNICNMYASAVKQITFFYTMYFFIH